MASSSSSTAPGGCGAAAAQANTRSTQKREPTPSSLSTPTLPPINAARSLTMARPRPLPPWRRVLDASTCSKASKIVPSWSDAMPMPVSVTATRTVSARASCASTSRSRRTLPRSVNLVALCSRLTSSWRSRNGSALTRCGRRGETVQRSSIGRSRAVTATSSTASATSSRRSMSAGLRRSLPFSIRDRSSTSLISASSALAERCAVCT